MRGQVDEAAADLANRHVGIAAPSGLGNHGGDHAVGEREIAVYRVNLLALGCVPIPCLGREGHQVGRPCRQARNNQHAQRQDDRLPRGLHQSFLWRNSTPEQRPASGDTR
jgi:hypothetical protein